MHLTKPFTGLVLHLLLITSAVAQVADETPLSQELVADDYTQQGITAVRDFAASIHSWSSSTAKATADYRHEMLSHSSEFPQWSTLVFRNGSDSVAISPILEALHDSALPAKEVANEAMAFSQSGVLDSSLVFNLTCYCKAYKQAYFDIPDSGVLWVIAVAKNQTESYQRTVDSSIAFLVKAKDVIIQLNTLDGLLEGKSMDRSTKTGRELDRIQKLRKSIAEPPFKQKESFWLQDASEEMAARMTRLTALANQKSSAERAMASVDLACGMSDFDKSVSMEHRVVDAWTHWVGCERTLFNIRMEL